MDRDRHWLFDVREAMEAEAPMVWLDAFGSKLIILAKIHFEAFSWRLTSTLCITVVDCITVAD